MARLQPTAARQTAASKPISAKNAEAAPLVCVVVQGAFEKSDSIGFDAVFQYRVLKSLFGASVFIFAERFDQARYPDVPFQPVAKFFSEARFRNATVIYHYCDGWEDFDRALLDHQGRSVVRWHNNTPPWFYAPDSLRLAERCVRGFESIVGLARDAKTEFWVNSDFTGDQLATLGADAKRIHTVYPASRYLSMPVEKRPDHGFGASGAIRFLFVSRVVAHKGHKHVISIAKYIQDNIGRKVIIDFAGRPDSSAKAFNSDLDAAIAESRVEVNLLGEVDESVLKDLYLTADIFVCCSEHEGFGLPTFEAMRCGLPTMTWARTAFTELLADLPTGIQKFDIPTFAGVVTCMEQPAFRQAIVDLQIRIAERYSTTFITSQIRHALASQGSPKPEWNLALNKAERAQQTKLRLEIERCAETVRSKETQPTAFQPREEGHNVVTAYDIQSYRSLINGAAQSFDRRVANSAADRSLQSVRLPFSEFFSIGGEQTPEGIVMPLDTATKGHVVFGPYAACPPGTYEATFHFSAVSSALQGNLVLETYSEESGILARRAASLSHTHSGTFKVDFTVVKDRETLEFRVKLTEPGKGKALFTGVSVGKLNLLSQLVQRNNPKLKPVRPAWLEALATWFKPDFSELRPPSKAGRKLFKAADGLRDQKNWAAAAKAYRDALEIDPGRVRYIIQMANCLKEAGSYPEAESAYLAAISLTPREPDIWLQLSDLYDRMGNIEGTRMAWRETLRTSTPAMEALRRLALSGNSAEEVQSFIEGTRP